jgi:hypothetical protein
MSIGATSELTTCLSLLELLALVASSFEFVSEAKAIVNKMKMELNARIVFIISPY